MSGVTRDLILKEIANDKFYYETCGNICFNQPVQNLETGNYLNPEYLQKELYSELLYSLCEIKDDLLIKLYQKNQLKWFLIRIINNQAKSSSTSRYYRNVKRRYFHRIDTIKYSSKWGYGDNNTILKDLENEWMDFIQSEISKLHWYNQKIWRMYIDERLSREAISRKLKIPINSIRETIKEVQNILKEKVRIESERLNKILPYD